MSGYARAASALGAAVSGSDGARSTYTDRLAQDGILTAQIGHRAENVPEGDDVVLFYSTAVAGVAVAGTHGKTTTSSMLVHALRGAGIDPGWLVGGSVGGELPNSNWTGGEWLVVEADESDRSMLSLAVEIAVLTNVELEHHATYGSLAELRAAFAALLAGAQQAVIWDRPELLSLRDGDLVAYDVADVTLTPGGSRFRWRGHEVTLAVPGVHNALDATGALEAARLAGAGEAQAAASLASFTGAGRRFQRLGLSGRGGVVYEDYAHHPTEIAATLRGARTLEHSRLVAVFQPHLFSRTALLAREFGQALALADEVFVLDVYPARERAEDFPGVSGLTIAESAADASGGRQVYWLPSFAQAEKVLGAHLRTGDVCVVMGAGDVQELARGLVAG
jgi:UDP-N-acetylmuramate--alanine ligase